jgi:hypothetical protein
MKNQICYYCGKIAVTKQHIPGRIFFPNEIRNNLLTVPSCSKHNYGTRFLEERMMLYLLGASGTRLANNFFNNKIKKVLMRPENKGLREYLVNNYDLDRKREILVSTKDVNDFIILLVSGLYFIHTGEVTNGHIYYLYNKVRGKRIRYLRRRLDLIKFTWKKGFKIGNSKNPQIFYYKYLIDKEYSFWLIKFYKTAKFIAVINNRRIYKKDI